MSERIFRIILRISLLILLGLNSTEGMYAYMGLLLFEGLTNWRIPILLSNIRFGNSYKEHVNTCEATYTTIPIEAKRMLRVMVLTLLIITYIFYNELFLGAPWLIGIMLCSAGLTGICPTVMTPRTIGFRE